jgi:NAD(P)H-nitrite reductase large subunit
LRFEHLIVGGSAGAVSAVEAIRSVDEDASIAVVYDEEVPGYSRPLISHFLAGELSLDGIMFRSVDFWSRNKVRLIHDAVVEVDPDDRVVKLAGGERLGYGRMLLAVGGEPITPKLEGEGGGELYTFTTLKDAEKISSRLSDRHRVAVIGGGPIGVSLAEALTKRGKKVTLIELKTRVLSQVLDERASRILEGEMTRAGVEVLTGRAVAAVHRNGGRTLSLELDNGEKRLCDLAVAAIGVKPRVRLAEEAGIAVNRGITVDDAMHTSAPEIYACGDVAEVYDFAHGLHRPLALWPVARGSGKTAGYSMAGLDARYEGATAMNAMNYFNTPIITVGSVNPEDPHMVSIRLDKGRSSYRRIVLKDGLIVGFTLMGEVEQAGLLLYLMRRRINVGHFKGRLCSPQFGLTILPQRVRREVLGK